MWYTYKKPGLSVKFNTLRNVNGITPSLLQTQRSSSVVRLTCYRRDAVNSSSVFIDLELSSAGISSNQALPSSYFSLAPKTVSSSCFPLISTVTTVRCYSELPLHLFSASYESSVPTPCFLYLLLITETLSSLEQTVHRTLSLLTHSLEGRLKF